MTLRRLTVLFAALLFTSIASASELDQILENIHTMKADFVQTIYDNHNKAIQKSTGQMAMERPGKFRWQIQKPIPQLIIANDTRLWIYDADLQQVTIRALHNATGESPALLLTHENAQLDKDYIVKPGQSQAGAKTFTLQPRGADSVFEQVEMSFMNGQLTGMKLKDHIGHETRIQFKQTQTNVKLPTSLFVFKKSANTDVIDETTRKKQ